MVDENPTPTIEEVSEDEDEISGDELRKKMEKIWDEADKKKRKTPYDDPPWGGGDPWTPKDPWKPNPYEPYKPSEDGWDKWVDPYSLLEDMDETTYVSTDNLQEAINKAIEEENYEAAEKLRKLLDKKR